MFALGSEATRWIAPNSLSRPYDAIRPLVSENAQRAQLNPPVEDPVFSGTEGRKAAFGRGDRILKMVKKTNSYNIHRPTGAEQQGSSIGYVECLKMAFIYHRPQENDNGIRSIMHSKQRFEVDEGPSQLHPVNARCH